MLALTLPGGVGVASLRLGLRPTLRFPRGVAARARGLATAGLAGLLAQQLTLLVVVVVTGRVEGGVLVYTWAWAVFLLPWAVLAVPVATSAFAALSEHEAAGRGERFARTNAAATRAVLLVSGLGAGVVAGTAHPVARMFLGSDDPVGRSMLARALLALAPGLLGYGLVALCTRSLYASGASRTAAFATVVGWLVAAGGSAGLAGALDDRALVAGVAAAHSAGFTLAALLQLAEVRRRCGTASLHGGIRACAAALLGAVAAGLAAWAVADLFTPQGKVANAVLAAGAAGAGTLAFGLVTATVDGKDVRELVSRRWGRA